MASVIDTSPATSEVARPTLAAFLVAWVVFWLLMVTVAVQDFQRLGHQTLWQPLLWEFSSCVVTSLAVVLLWKPLHALDAKLTQPMQWFLASLKWLVPSALAFVVVVYAVRHAVYAALGEVYHHEPWGKVFQYETIKFSLFYLLFVAILFGLRSHAVLSAERMRSARLANLAQHAQLLQLTQQIEPHFLFNALNTVAATIHTNPNLADTLLVRLATLLRAATDLGRQSEVTLAQELQLLAAYTDIMCNRFAPRVVVQVTVDAQAQQCLVPTLSLQPIVENAFRHGVEKSTHSGQIRVECAVKYGVLHIDVRDEFGQMAGPCVFGTGLANLQQRLTLRHPGQTRLEVQDEPAAVGGSEVNATGANPTPSRGVWVHLELPCVL